MKESKEVKEKWYKKDYKLLHERKSNKVDKLFQLYAKDKYIARVIYMNDTSGYEQYRTVLFTEENGDFTIVIFRRKYGISKSNVIYNHQKRVAEVIYKGGKFYLVDNTGARGGIKTLTMDTLSGVCGRVNFTLTNRYYDMIIGLLATRFTWVRFLEETKVCTNVAFNTIVSKKLFNKKKALTHQYKTNYPIAKMLDAKLKSNNSHAHNLVKVLQGYMPYIKNIESLNEEWFDKRNVGIFHDTLKMGKTLNKQVNASWSSRRLKEEHDKWAKILSDILFIDGNRDMNLSQIYKDFSEYSGYELISTTRDMAYEGKRQNHCVATYVNNVENGYCAIITTKEYTVELRTKHFKGIKVITIAQVKGYGNSEPKRVFLNELDNRVLAFNKSITDGKFEEKDLNAHPTWDPFGDVVPAAAIRANNDTLPF